MVWTSLLDRTLKSYLGFRTRPGVIAKYFDNKEIKGSPHCQKIDLARVRVAALQIPLFLVSDPLQWVEMIYQQVQKATTSGAQLIVFPENITLHLLGLIPGVKKLSEQDLSKFMVSSPPEESSFEVTDIFRLSGSIFEGIYLQTMSTLAEKFQVFIMGGSRIVPDETGQVMNIASLFSPTGQLIGSQAKCHLLPLEAEWGLCQGLELKVFKTTIGNIAFPVCMDATYFETFRILSLLGADLIIVPIANPEEYHLWKALRGIWPRVQESYVYGVKSALVGNGFFGLNFTGKAGIFAPLELHGNNGILALADNPHQEDMVIADLNIRQLRETKKDRLYMGDYNLALYRRYFPAIYND